MTDDDYGKPTFGFTRLTTSLETTKGHLGTTQTPLDRFFVCSASAAPKLPIDDWALTIAGDAVAEPVTIGFDQLISLPQVEVTAWLECAGNGRSMFELIHGEHVPAENAHTGWMLGGMGMARWKGPRLRDVLALAKPTGNAAFVAPVGLDVENTEGEPAKMCLPLDKAIDDATIVATHMNGDPLTRAHGAPARVIVPGWVGAYSVKWLGGFVVSKSWVPSWRSDVYYVHRTPEDEITGHLTSHPVKSSLALPYPATAVSGPQEIMGYARSGDGAITEVMWSLDDGPWLPAKLDEPEGPYAWTVFRIDVDLQPGEHVLRTKATDSTGQSQPERQPFHPYGVLWQSIIPHRISVSNVLIRPGTADDAAAVATIWHQGWRDGHLGFVPDELLSARTPESFAERSPERVSDTTVITVDGVVAGFVMVVGDEAEQVYLDSSHRGSGIAATLLAEAERQVLAAGHDAAWLAVVAGNARARAFYERQGWRDDGPFSYAAHGPSGPIEVPCHRYTKPLGS